MLQGKVIGTYPFAKVSDMNLAGNSVCIREANNWVDDADLAVLKAKPFPPGTTVFAKIGEALKANRLRFLVRASVVDNNMMGAIPALNAVDPRFFFYALTRFDFGEIAGGTALPYLTVGALSQLELPLPPLDEQRAIAHILGTLDDKIELNRRRNATLEAMARALFKAWFIDFEPARAKLEGRWQRGQSLPGLPAHLYDLFPNRLVDSDLGEIPEGWAPGTLSDLSALNPEAWSKRNRPARLRYVDLSNTKWGRIENTVEYAITDAPSRAQRILRAGDSIVGVVRPGNGSYAFISENGLTGSTGFAALRPSAPHLAAFVYLAATARENIDTLANLADGGAYPAVRPEMVVATPAVRPSDDVLKHFERVAGEMLSQMAVYDRESRTLAALRDTLLPKLISGELRIADAKRFIEART